MVGAADEIGGCGSEEVGGEGLVEVVAAFCGLLEGGGLDGVGWGMGEGGMP